MHYDWVCCGVEELGWVCEHQHVFTEALCLPPPPPKKKESITGTLFLQLRPLCNSLQTVACAIHASGTNLGFGQQKRQYLRCIS
uniref:Uncharacterized protein n=1 Tax=Anguilla anguilla TaxID=7936 RepID=A0A0E9RF42_ANGAN